MYFMGFSICLSIALITMGVYVSAILYRASKSLRNYCKKSKQKSDIENEKKDNDKDTVEMPGRDRSEKYRQAQQEDSQAKKGAAIDIEGLDEVSASPSSKPRKEELK